MALTKTRRVRSHRRYSLKCGHSGYGPGGQSWERMLCPVCGELTKVVSQQAPAALEELFRFQGINRGEGTQPSPHHTGGTMRLDLNDIDPTGELARAFARMETQRNGSARQAMWQARDGWCIAYTTERITGGPFDGRFATMAYKPTGKGARSGKANEWVRVYYRGFSTRKAARARAEKLYHQHNDKS